MDDCLKVACPSDALRLIQDEHGIRQKCVIEFSSVHPKVAQHDLCDILCEYQGFEAMTLSAGVAIAAYSCISAARDALQGCRGMRLLDQGVTPSMLDMAMPPREARLRSEAEINTDRASVADSAGSAVPRRQSLRGRMDTLVHDTVARQIAMPDPVDIMKELEEVDACAHAVRTKATVFQTNLNMMDALVWEWATYKVCA